MPNLPCPKCGANLFTEGFYNSCTEVQRLREDNYAHIANGRLAVEHDEDNFETIEHHCDVQAFCSTCHGLLPWPLYRLRHLHGTLASLAEKAIARLLAELGNASKPADA